MVDNTTHRAKIDFNDSALKERSPASLIPGGGTRRDMRNKDVSSLLRRKSKGFRVSNSLGGGSIISPLKPVRVSVPGNQNDKYSKEHTSKLLRDIENEVEEVIEIEVESIRILNQTWLKPLHPLGKCLLVINPDKNVSLFSRNKLIDCFDFNLTQNLQEVYFRHERNVLERDLVVVIKDKRQMTRKELNLLDPDLVPSQALPKFNKVWFKVKKSINYVKFHELVNQLNVKIFHESLKGLTALFLNPTSTSAFYGKQPTSTFLKARGDKTVVDSEPIIDTRPRTRANIRESRPNTPVDLESGGDIPETVIEEEDKHENIAIEDQIRFVPSLNFRFEDKRMFTITNSDFKCLYNNFWINDTLIDFFLKLNVEASIRTGHIKSTEVMLLNSFFYTKLVKNENYYDNVKSWFKDDKLFSYRYVIIPINQDLHWYCLIIHNLDKVYEDMQNETITIDEDENKIEIFILDSLNQDHKAIKAPLASFLTDYAKEKYNITLTNDKFKMYTSPIPKQRNFNDCGIHVIYNIEIFLSKTDEFKELWKKPRKKVKNYRKLFLVADRQNLRMKLREDLVEMLKQQEESNGNPDYSKVGHLTNKYFSENSFGKTDVADEEEDSDFEIIESKSHEDYSVEDDRDFLNHEEHLTRSKTKELAEKRNVKSRYFNDAKDLPESLDSALIPDTMDNELSAEYQSPEVSNLKSENPSKPNEISLLSRKLRGSKISAANLFDFLDSVSNDSNGTIFNAGKFEKYIATENSAKLFYRVIDYLSKFEAEIAVDEKYEDDLVVLIKYFNGLEDTETPDKEILVSYFESFLDVYDEKETSSGTEKIEKTKHGISTHELSEKKGTFMAKHQGDSNEGSDLPMESSQSAGQSPSPTSAFTGKSGKPGISGEFRELSQDSYDRSVSPGNSSPANVLSFLKAHKVKKGFSLPVRKVSAVEHFSENKDSETNDNRRSIASSSENGSEIIASTDVVHQKRPHLSSKSTTSINISDTEDYAVFHSSVSNNREKFMSSFPSSEDAIEILGERKVVRGSKEQLGVADDREDEKDSPLSKSETSSRSILNVLPRSNGPAKKFRKERRGHKKQKIG